jgi:5-formyltetrahydrofolate cyclo-ligase
MDKSALRKRYRQERSLMNPTAIELNSWRHILTTPEVGGATTIASYFSYGDEPSTVELNNELLKLKKRLVLPRILPDMNLEWIPWSGSQNELAKKGKFFEPKGEPINSDEIDLVIIPCLHVNREGYRLGQGGGSYDRALASMRAYRIGLIYTGELTNEHLPIEDHDQRLSAVATPELIVRF